IGCSKCCLCDTAGANLGLGLKPILLRIAPERTPLQEQLVSAQAHLLLRGRRRDRDRAWINVWRRGDGSLLGAEILSRSGRIKCLFGSWHMNANSLYTDSALAGGSSNSANHHDL